MFACLNSSNIEGNAGRSASDLISVDANIHVDMCGVEGKRRLCDLNVTSSSPALATRHIRIVMLVNSPNKLNLLSWL